MTDRRHKKMLVEEALGAWRPRTPDGTLQPHPAWADLDGDGRAEVFEETIVSRRLERALDDAGYSTTVRAVLSRLQR